MKKSEFIRIIREEIKAVLELTQAEKAANITAAQADIKAKQLALKNTQDKLKKAQAAQVDQT